MRIRVGNFLVFPQPMAELPSDFMEVITARSRPPHAHGVEPNHSVFAKKTAEEMLGTGRVHAPVVGKNQNRGAFKHVRQASRTDRNTAGQYDQSCTFPGP